MGAAIQVPSSFSSTTNTKQRYDSLACFSLDRISEACTASGKRLAISIFCKKASDDDDDDDDDSLGYWA